MPSQQPKVIVTGASGLLGRAVFKTFNERQWDVKGLAFSRADGNKLVKVDLHDTEAVKELLSEFKPDVVVHCAAERRPDVAEKDPVAAEKLNVGVPKTLSLLSKDPSHPFVLIYISTDYVFDGQNPPSGGYTSKDKTGPTNAYAKSKLEGEKCVLDGRGEDRKAIVLRVPVLYGEVSSNEESAINTLVNSIREAAQGKQVKMDDWASRRPTNVEDVARVLVDLSDKSLSSSSSLPPILHFSSQQPPLTKYDISKLFTSLHNPPLDLNIVEKNLVPVSSAPGPGETLRPKDCWLSNAELEELGINTSTIDFENWWKGWFERNPFK